MGKGFIVSAVTLVLLSVTACAGIGKGKAPPPAPVQQAPIVTKG